MNRSQENLPPPSEPIVWSHDPTSAMNAFSSSQFDLAAQLIRHFRYRWLRHNFFPIGHLPRRTGSGSFFEKSRAFIFIALTTELPRMRRSVIFSILNPAYPV
jgi:hypothetical protein